MVTVLVAPRTSTVLRDHTSYVSEEKHQSRANSSDENRVDSQQTEHTRVTNTYLFRRRVFPVSMRTLFRIYLDFAIGGRGRCPECAFGDLDFALSGDGRWDITWRFVPCEDSSDQTFLFEGSNEFYWKVRRSQRVVGRVSRGSKPAACS